MHPQVGRVPTLGNAPVTSQNSDIRQSQQLELAEQDLLHNCTEVQSISEKRKKTRKAYVWGVEGMGKLIGEIEKLVT